MENITDDLQDHLEDLLSSASDDQQPRKTIQ